MNVILETEVYRSQRDGLECSLVFMDLDHFKTINDTHGHLLGSTLLAEIGAGAARQLQGRRFRLSLRRR